MNTSIISDSEESKDFNEINNMDYSQDSNSILERIIKIENLLTLSKE
jgi:hypothetical protein